MIHRFNFNLKVGLLVAAAICFSTIALPAFAESAPVYDVDSLDQQYDNSDQQDIPPPPAAQESGVVPVQPNQEPSSPISLDQRVRRVEQQIDNIQTSDLAQRVEALQNEIQALRGQLENLTHQLEAALNQQKTMYSDLDTRLTQVTNTKQANMPLSATAVKSPPRKVAPLAMKQPAKESDGKVTTATNEAAKSPQDPDVAQEQQIYQTAYNLIKAKKYGDAASALQAMLKKYPSGQFASNAHYWLGELYGLMGKNDQALTEFDMVVKNYPNSPRVSDAQLKVGLILAAQSKYNDAKLIFKKVIDHYPGTASARLAAEQLKQIKQIKPIGR